MKNNYYNFMQDYSSVNQRGFALLIAVIFMSVMLTFGLELGSLAYKQQVLSSSAVQAQYAFYAADSVLECALYADQQQNFFAYNSDMNAPAPIMQCGKTAPVISTVLSHTLSRWVITQRFSLDSDKKCADVTIYKGAVNQSGVTTTSIFAQGYNVSCATVSSPNGARIVSRGESAQY